MTIQEQLPDGGIDRSPLVSGAVETVAAVAFRLLKAPASSFRRSSERRRDQFALVRMSDYLLRDIGLTRSGLEFGMLQITD